jgi:hypothetical protein
MFRHRNGLIVSQWEHSRLSGELALLVGQATGVDFPELFAAIALHDWPHFRNEPLADQIAIGEKTAEQQRELASSLRSDIPFSPLVQLVILLHWKRLSDEVEIHDAINDERLHTLMKNVGIDQDTAERMDRWTDLCDTFAFYISRGEAAHGKFLLPHPRDAFRSWKLAWHVNEDHLEIRGLGSDVRSSLRFVAYDSVGYPNLLSPQFLAIPVDFE